jgi:LuxR family maltose regulon positive regulatory protein
MALKAFSRALAQAEPGGYIRLFVDEGEPMKRLLLQAVSRGIAVEYASELLTVMQASEGMVFGAASSSPVEQLSQRELEILRLLKSSLSSPEIAEKLYISVGTVRTHIKNIYRKLDVNRRTEAVERARELGLI